jgi:predicted Zn-dependent protease
MTPIRIPARAWLALAATALAGALGLVLTFPPDRVIGLMFETDEEWEGAIRFFNAWNARHPKDRESRWHTVELLVATARPTEAIALLESMAKADPEPRVYERLAEIADSLLDLKATLRWTEALAKLRPDDPGLLVRLAEYYRWFGRQPELVATLTALVRLAPDRAEEHQELIEEQLFAGRAEELVAFETAFLTAHPDALLPHLALFRAHLARGASDRALAELELLSKLKGTSAEEKEQIEELFRAHAQRLARGGRSKEAEALYRARIAESPTDLELRLELAELYGSGRRADEVAAAELKELLRLAPDALPAWKAYADRLSALEHAGDAAAALARAVELAPEEPGLHRKLARELALAGKRREAIAQHRWLIAHDKATPADKSAMVELLLELGTPGEAVAPALALAKGAPDDLSVHRTLAHAAIAAKRCGDALPLLRAFAERRSVDSEPWSLYGLCAKQVGMNAEALEALRRAARLHQR